ncbi:MAG: hypothetical protein OXK78_00650, partial [Caldilineaceae bacterium]|nr:hypothetical protein [Caldilineaceae bacterium]
VVPVVLASGNPILFGGVGVKEQGAGSAGSEAADELPVTRETLEQRESRDLAAYAMRSCDSRGRAYAAAEHPYRTIYQRDRDRIVHTTAFRRL